MEKSITEKDKARARFLLMSSAERSKIHGVSPERWVHDPFVLQMIDQYNLKNDLGKHIAIFVWNPYR